MNWQWVSVLLLGLACAGPGHRPGSAGPDATQPNSNWTPREVLTGFVAAIEAEDWNRAYALLSARWRGQLTAARLAADYVTSGGVGRTATARVRALLASGAPLTVDQEKAVLPVGEGKSSILVQENGGWKVDALE